MLRKGFPIAAKPPNNRMQSDKLLRYAPQFAADARRYKAPVGNKLKKAVVHWCQTEVTQI